ncbi:MAG TPA: ComEC/Rec2 family competence protein [Acidimicrobiales bacterium]|nr:ComEC/Rec2 family competence protein [Acidimicrobiales bacterium]
MNGTPSRVLSDSAAIAMALASFAAATVGWSIAVWIPLVGVVIALVLRRPLLLVIAVVVLAAALGARSDRALALHVREREVRSWVTVVRDPEQFGVATRLDVRLGRTRLEVNAYSAPARAMSGLLVGERVEIVGTVRPRLAYAPWLDQRHVIGRLDVREVLDTRSAAWPYSWANTLRRTLHRGASSLGHEHRGLFTGFVYGDDRDQPSIIADDFRGSGLGHLLAVSGANVAFVAALLAPLFKRLDFRLRFVALSTSLAFFALVTRFEPSVLRAIVMASIAGLAAAMGRTVSMRRVIALTCTVLVLVDPVIARSVGFQLSLLATAGIVELAPSIASRLPGPRWLALAASVTIAAQIAVAPVEVARFGGMPLAALPANILAAPAAGPIMMWGLTAGLIAGIAGGPIATIVHLPTHALVWWVAGVARAAARAPFGELRTRHLLVLLTAAGIYALTRSVTGRRLAVVLAVVALAHPPVTFGHLAAGEHALANGITVLRGADGTTVLTIHDTARARSTLEALRRHGVRRVSLLVATDGGRASGEVVRALRSRLSIGEIWAPSLHQIRGARTPPLGSYRVGMFEIAVTSTTAPMETRPV